MNARDTIVAALHGAAGWTTDRPERLVAEHRAEVLAETEAELARDFTLTASPTVSKDAVLLFLRNQATTGENATPAGATATPFFQPGHTYAREHHGHTIRFLVEHIATAPDGTHRVAFGWRNWPDDDGTGWEPTDSDDLTGWTDTTNDTTTGDNT